MDYRNLDASRVRWKGNKASYGGAGKFAFQTPPFKARLEPLWKFPGAINVIRIQCDDTHFLEFVDGLKVDAAEAVDLCVHTAYPAFDKLTAFSNTEFFDVAGDPLDRVEEMGGVFQMAAILQLDGVWEGSGGDRWALKFKVIQMKVYGPVDLKRENVVPLFLTDDVESDTLPPPPPYKKPKTPFLFMSDV